MNPKFPSKMLKSSFLSGKSNRSQSTMALDRDYEVIEPRPTPQTLQSPSVPLRCDLCGSMKALVRCEQCSNRVFCFVCDETFHKHPKRNRHNRKALQKESTLQRPPLPPKSIQEVRVTVTPPQPPPRKNKKSFFLSSLTQKFEIQSEPHKGLVAFGNSLKNVFSNRPLPPTPQENKLGSNFSKNQFSHNSSLPNSANPTFKPKSQSVSAENWSKFLDFSNENSQNFVNSQNSINTSQKFSDLSSQKSQNFADIPKQMPQNFANNVPQKVHEQPNLKGSCKLFRNSPKEEVFHEFPKSRSRENSIGIPRNVSHEFNSTNSVCNLNSDVQNKFFQPVSFLGNQDMMTSGFHQMSLMNLNPCLHSPLNCQPQHLLQPMTKSTSNQSMNNANLHDISGGGIYPFAPPMHSHVAFPYYGYYPGYAPGYVPEFSGPSPIRHGSAISIPDFVRGCNRVPSSPAPSARSSSNRSQNCSRGRSFSFSNSQSGGHKTTGARGGTGSSVRASEIESAFSSTPGSSENEQPDSFSKHRKGNQSWQCEHCTFINRMSARICGMCSKKPENVATHENSLDINSNSRIQKSHTSDRYFRKNQREKAGSREYQSQSNLKSLDYFRCSSKTPNHMAFTSPNSSSEFENFPDFQNEHFRKNKNIEANHEPKDNISKKKETGSRYRNRKKCMTDRSMTPGRNSPLRISKNERVYSGNKSSTECRNVDSVKVSSRRKEETICRDSTGRKEETICRDSTGRKEILGGCSLKIKNSKRPKENRTWRSFSQGNLNENVTGRVNSDSSDAKSLDEKNISPFLNRKILIKNSGSGKQKSSMKSRYASQKSKETLANEYIAVHEQNSKNERPRKSNDAAQYRCQTNRNSRAEKEKPFTSKTNRNQETMRQINAKNSHFDNRNYQYLTKDESSDSVENENLDSETSINNGSIDSENNEVSSSEISEIENLASENSENVASEISSYVENSENESIDNEISSGSDKLFYGEKENSNYINRENLNKHVKQYLASDSEDNNEIFIANAQIRKNSSQGLKNVSITNFKAKKYDKSNKIKTDTKSCTNRAKNSSRLKKDTHPQSVENLEERLHSESKEKEVDPKFNTKLKLNFIESKTSIAPTKSERKAAKLMSKQIKTKAKSKESESKSKNMEPKSVSRNSLSSSDLFYSTPNSPALCQNKRSPEHDKGFEEKDDKSEESKIYETLVSPILKKMIAEISRKGEEIPEISKSLKQKIVEALSQEDSELNDIQLAPNDEIVMRQLISVSEFSSFCDNFVAFVSENEELEDYSEGSSKKSPKSKAVNLPVKSNESFVQKLGESKLDSIPWIEDYDELSKKRLVIPPAVASFSGPIFIPTTLNEDFEEHEYINHTPHRSDSINVGDTVNKQMNVEISEENADEHEKNSQIKDLKKRIELSSTSSQIKELRQEIKTIKKELESEAINRKSDSDQNISESDQDNEMESEHDSVKSEQNELKIRRAEGKLEHNKAENETNLETKLPEIINEQEFENENKLGAERKEEETKQQGAESQINTMKNKLAVEHNFNSDDTNLSNDYNKESFDNSTSNIDNSTANTSQNLPGSAKPESEIIRQVSPQILVQNFKTSEERELGSSFLSSPKFQTLKSMINTNEKTQEQKEQLEFDRKVRRFLAEGQAETYDKAELAAHLTNLNFEENEALQAAENCSSIYTAMKFLQQYCELCDDKFPMGKMVSMLHCTHRCCIDCARSYFSTQIKTKSIHDLRCPFCFEPDLDKCEDSAAEYLNNLDILLKNIVEVDIHELFQRKLRDWTLMKEPNFRWCNKCSSGFISNPRARKLICPDCRDVTCSSCRKQWAPEHVGISCENFAKWLRENDPDNFGVGEGVAKHLAENGITCPNCRFTYSLAKGGCMHFTCTECKYEFCSGCSEPFKQGAKCTVGPYCERLGLHSHHPRNCLFYLRDKEPEVLQKLLKDNNIEFFTEPLIENETGKDICRISIQKETKDGFEDDICGRITREGNAGMCKAHYIEYLVEKVNNNRLDPVIIFDEADLRVCLRRNGKTVPMRRWESENYYRDKLIKLITEQMPLM